MKEYKFWIVNQVDRPYTRHVCQEVEPGKLSYIHDDLRAYTDKHGVMEVHEKSTPIEDFGFEVEIIGDTAHFTKTSSSKATYANGSKRNWQGQTSFSLQVK